MVVAPAVVGPDVRAENHAALGVRDPDARRVLDNLLEHGRFAHPARPREEHIPALLDELDRCGDVTVESSTDGGKSIKVELEELRVKQILERARVEGVDEQFQDILGSKCM